jgi:hypothetical protein
MRWHLFLKAVLRQSETPWGKHRNLSEKYYCIMQSNLIKDQANENESSSTCVLGYNWVTCGEPPDGKARYSKVTLRTPFGDLRGT